MSSRSDQPVTGAPLTLPSPLRGEGKPQADCSLGSEIRMGRSLLTIQGLKECIITREVIVEQHHDLEAVRAMLGHTRIDTTQTCAQIRPAQLKRAVEFYEEKATDLLGN